MIVPSAPSKNFLKLINLSYLSDDHHWGLADGPMMSHWLGGRHWGLAIGFPIGPSP
jgi:hypothetical protein